MPMYKMKIACGVMLLAFTLSACQKSSDQAADAETQSSAAQSENTLLSLQGNNEKLLFHPPECRGKDCPSFEIERLHSNQFVLDDVIDQAIVEQLEQILSPVEQKALQQAGEKALAAAQPKSEEEELQAASAVASDRDARQPALHRVDTPAQRLAQQIQPYFATFIGLSEELKTLRGPQQLSVSVRPRILNANAPLATVVMNSSSYLGGAHGASAQKYYNFDLEQQKVLKLQDIIAPQKMPQLEKLAYAAFQTWVKDNQLADNIKDYEKVWKFKMSANFYLGQQGLILQYDEYELGPYVVGLARLDLPYAQLDGILKAKYLPESASQSPASAVVKN